jgi:peptide/nickel transport system substrate-binding protein
MSFKTNCLAAVAGLALLCGTAQAQTLRYANQGELKSLDPYTVNETTTHAHLGHPYEGLIRRGKNLEILPGLAESWTISDDGKTWRFALRKGVKFHGGEDFTADDVVFSADRARAPGSNVQTRVPTGTKVVKIDDHTVEFQLTSPNPILHYQWDTWYILSKTWAEKNNSTAPTPASATTPTFASLNANGTGAFKVESHQPGVKTVFKVNENWWNKSPEHNLKEIVFTPIASDATRVAALLSGEVDVIEPVPIQDIQRVNGTGTVQVLTGPELRTIFLGMDQVRDELVESSVKGKNPFKDIRVRKAFYQAIDIETIKTRVMRGLATPSPLMIAPELFPHTGFTRAKFDATEAKKLLTDAGYPDGFTVGMDCPNDRYVNDGQICQAVVGMLARIGVKVNLNAQPKGQYFAKVLKPGGYNTSFYLLGWTPGTSDAHNVLFDIMGCRDNPASSRGEANVAGYCNKKVDELTDKIIVEADKAKRDAMIKEAFQIAADDFGYIPLHQQALAWGVSKKVKLTQRADNAVHFQYAVKE